MSDRIELEEPTQAALREARKLVRRKERKSVGKFLVEGRQAVREALRAPEVVESVFVRWGDARYNLDLIERARVAGITVYGVSEQNLATMSDTVTPQGVIAVARSIDVSLSDFLGTRKKDPTAPRRKHERKDVSLVVICAQIRDPGNAGTVIRCADAFGADAVLVSTESVDLYNPKTVRASTGSVFHLPIAVGVDLADTVTMARAADLAVFGADGAAHCTVDDLASTQELAAPTLWVFGNEAWGLPAEHAELLDRLVALPIYGRAESLNLSTAAAVLLYATATAQRATTCA